MNFPEKIELMTLSSFECTIGKWSLLFFKRFCSGCRPWSGPAKHASRWSARRRLPAILSSAPTGRLGNVEILGIQTEVDRARRGSAR